MLFMPLLNLQILLAIHAIYILFQLYLSSKIFIHNPIIVQIFSIPIPITSIDHIKNNSLLLPILLKTSPRLQFHNNLQPLHQLAIHMQKSVQKLIKFYHLYLKQYLHSIHLHLKSHLSHHESLNNPILSMLNKIQIIQ